MPTAVRKSGERMVSVPCSAAFPQCPPRRPAAKKSCAGRGGMYAGVPGGESATTDQHTSPPFFVAAGGSGSAGLDNIKALLAALPSGLQAVMLVVLHRPSDRISNLRDVLARVSALPVLIPDEDDEFRVGACYI